MIYKRGQQIVGVITNVTDDPPERGISYTITSGTESFACSDFHDRNFTLNTITSYDSFDEYMNPPEEKEEELYKVYVSAGSDDFDCKNVKSTYIEDGFLHVINSSQLAIKLDDILYYKIEPQKKEEDDESK